MIDVHEGGKRLAHCAKKLDDERFLDALNHYLARPELQLEPATSGPEIPAIYIVGAPRSGTTLLSQVVSRFLPVGYINNLIARFWLRPSVGIRLSSILLGEDPRAGIAFSSKHGVTDGLAGPHEFGYFWTHWLQLNEARTHHLSAAEIAAIDRRGLQSCLENEVLGTFGMPVVFKNVICGFQAPLLTELHGKSIFIHISRDLRSTCASILKSRFERYGDYSTWWSLKPSTFADLPGDPVKQVVRQVIDCRAELNRRMADSGAVCMDVEYEELCRNPNGVLEGMRDKLAGMGWPLAQQGLCAEFSPGFGAWLPDDLTGRLDVEIADLRR